MGFGRGLGGTNSNARATDVLYETCVLVYELLRFIEVLDFNRLRDLLARFCSPIDIRLSDVEDCPGTLAEARGWKLSDKLDPRSPESIPRRMNPSHYRVSPISLLQKLVRAKHGGHRHSQIEDVAYQQSASKKNARAASTEVDRLDDFVPVAGTLVVAGDLDRHRELKAFSRASICTWGLGSGAARPELTALLW